MTWEHTWIVNIVNDMGVYLDCQYCQWHGSVPGLSMTWDCTWIVNDMGVYLDCQWHGSVHGLSMTWMRTWIVNDMTRSVPGLSMTWDCTWIVNDMGLYLDCQWHGSVPGLSMTWDSTSTDIAYSQLKHNHAHTRMHVCTLAHLNVPLRRISNSLKFQLICANYWIIVNTHIYYKINHFGFFIKTTSLWYSTYSCLTIFRSKQINFGIKALWEKISIYATSPILLVGMYFYM